MYTYPIPAKNSRNRFCPFLVQVLNLHVHKLNDRYNSAGAYHTLYSPTRQIVRVTETIIDGPVTIYGQS